MIAEDQYIAELCIYTYDPDQREAVQIHYDYKDLSGAESGALTDAEVAGGTEFMVYAGKEPGSLYMARIVTDEAAFSDISEFTFGEGTRVTRNWTVSNIYSYYDKTDRYYLNGEEVSSDEGGRYFARSRDNYRELIMFSGYTDIMSVFSHVQSDRPVAMTYEDAMDWLDERV